MRFVPLGSGSRGNSALVEFGETRLLLDAGLSARDLGRRLDAVGVRPDQIGWILLTHEHDDHSRGVQRFSHKHGVPVVCTMETMEARDLSPVHFAEWLPLLCGQSLDLGPIRVESFPVPHDAANPVGFVIHGEGLRVGVVTDLGHATTLVRQRLRGCHMLMVESNYDAKMLQEGPYPWHIKQRVAGRLGHLSNVEASALLGETVDSDCRAVVLAHLSEKNNDPALARRTAAEAMQRAGCSQVTMRVARARTPTPAIQL